ncbi:outer membrane protein transport protein [Hymenobacter sp. NST-14]|uniref:OmpP1/FadL family transporter n=1 Tax=Hymenobacter piscis TaxID=2839984 RepID=UPI001C02D5FE|nr:outer membrane protein transport protein [Hymenobacter piscis]MBT9392987.1 outer membrane protein transport protein [Hymenobacter piscis]
MKLLKYGLAVALMGSASHAFAQYQIDALRYSQQQPTGTARTLGIGGASTAVGGDYGSVAVNPAGLGMYQRSEFSFSPGFSNLNSSSLGFGNTTTDSRSNLNVASLGMVFANRRPDDDANPWRASTLAIGITRTADFNQSFRYRGRPELEQDIFQRFSEDQGGALDDLAYNTFLTDTDAQGTYIPIDFDGTGQLDQGETVRRTGANTQFDIAYGASYQDKLYIGGGIGIVSSRYTAENVLTASDPQPVTPVSEEDGTSFASLSQRDNLQTKGGGINARLGIIYKPIEAVRLGASVQTPTYLRLTETYNASLDARFDKPVTVDGNTYLSASSALDPNIFDYAVTTPFKATAGAAFVLGKFGFLSGDVEYIDYASANLSNWNGRGDFGADNDAIRSLYTSAVNVRLGGEARLDIFRLRAGFAHYGSPYQSSTPDRSRNYYTVGAGLRQNNFFLDAAGVYSKGTLLYNPYSLARGNTPVISIDDNRFTTTITAGFMF